MLPDMTLQDLGMLDLGGALRAFDTFPWAEQLRVAQQMGTTNKLCVTPDLTFRIDTCHLTTRIREDGLHFEIEVCVPRLRRIFGLFGKVKFYELRGASPNQCREAIRVFFSQAAEAQHEYFSRQREFAA